MKRSSVERSARAAVPVASLLLSAVLVSGCVGSPTYGTGKPAAEQLFEGVTGVLSISSNANEERIEYKPRPKLVKPADKNTLPAPQESVVASNAGAWPESPEEVRERLRADATENRDNLGFKPRIKGPDVEDGSSAALADRNPNLSTAGLAETNEASRRRALARPEPARSRAQLDRNPSLAATEVDPKRAREEFNKRLAAQNQGSPTRRQFLSEPPIKYRNPADTAPVNDIGIDEDKKERQRKAAARKKSGKTSWRDFVPWL